MNKQFLEDVNAGLSAKQKYLLSKYFYDKKGDELFVKIMNSPEYYLTNAEFEIFSQQTSALAQAMFSKTTETVLVELGAGDGTKTIELLRHLQGKVPFTYMPVDISENALELLQSRLNREVPKVDVKTQQGDYFVVLEKLKAIDKPKVILFLGSNLGNMLDEVAHNFLTQLSQSMRIGDKLLLGLDEMKSVDKVLPAYNDAQGFTRQFNLNLLDRINRELGGNFKPDAFLHTPEYDEKEGIARSYLTSKKDQDVYISGLQKTFHFAAGERIFMEMSRKYNREIVDKMLNNTALAVVKKFEDQNQLFADFLCEKQPKD